jgi:hypothetical protein
MYNMYTCLMPHGGGSYTLPFARSPAEASGDSQVLSSGKCPGQTRFQRLCSAGETKNCAAPPQVARLGPTLSIENHPDLDVRREGKIRRVDPTFAS